MVKIVFVPGQSGPFALRLKSVFVFRKIYFFAPSIGKYLEFRQVIIILLNRDLNGDHIIPKVSVV